MQPKNKIYKTSSPDIARYIKRRLHKFPEKGEQIEEHPPPKESFQEESKTFSSIYKQTKDKFTQGASNAENAYALAQMYSEEIALTTKLDDLGGIRSRYRKAMSSTKKLVEKTNSLAETVKSPYFGRIDFKFSKSAPDRFKNKKLTFYIGKKGLRLKHNIITDWRAPVSSLYYNFAKPTRDCFYKTDKRIINGALKLKRKLEIDDTTLKKVYEGTELPGLVGSDPFLLKQLEKRSSSKLKDIIATIQGEQNKIISHELDKDIIVQGVAGSGKTSIAIHRLSWLLYNYKKLNPKQCLIIAPSKLFIRYIASLLPEIGTKNVPQMTFTEWAHHRLRAVIHNEEIVETDQEATTKSTTDFMVKIKKGVLKNNNRKSKETNVLKLYKQITDTDTISIQDLAPLLYTRTLLTGVLPAEKIHYLVVDEAQDLSPSELLVLKTFTDEGHMLIVGDIMQGIVNPNGVKSWENIIGEILSRDKMKLFNILTSYRTTKSIIEYVNKHLRKAGISANLFPRPVLRQGIAPTIYTKLEPDDMIRKIISIIRTEQTEDRNNIAVIVPCKHLKFFYNEISPHIDNVLKIEHEDSEYPGGVMLSHINLFKGLEFDTVIFVNLPEDGSPDLLLKQFYTACTRAMHRLFIFEC